MEEIMWGEKNEKKNKLRRKTKLLWRSSSDWDRGRKWNSLRCRENEANIRGRKKSQIDSLLFVRLTSVLYTWSIQNQKLLHTINVLMKSRHKDEQKWLAWMKISNCFFSLFRSCLRYCVGIKWKSYSFFLWSGLVIEITRKCN